MGASPQLPSELVRAEAAGARGAVIVPFLLTSNAEMRVSQTKREFIRQTTGAVLRCMGLKSVSFSLSYFFKSLFHYCLGTTEAAG